MEAVRVSFVDIPYFINLQLIPNENVSIIATQREAASSAQLKLVRKCLSLLLVWYILSVLCSLMTMLPFIDLFDPFPDTSGGLIRPFEMLALGT